MNLIQDAESILNGSRKDYSSIKTKTDNVFRAYINICKAMKIYYLGTLKDW